MTLPVIPETSFIERQGVIRVEEITNAARCVWRETLMRDVGIDGQIEYIDPQGRASGRIVGVQVKAGQSYFASASAAKVPYSPPDRHRRYWERFPLPVVLVMYEPLSDAACWIDARAAVREIVQGPIEVPRAQVFDESGVLDALRIDGPLPVEPTEPRELLGLLLAESLEVGGCEVSFLDLFVQGLTNSASWAVYFGMDLLDEVVRAKLTILRSRTGFSFTAETYESIDRYVAFLTAHDLARVDYDWFMQQARRYQLVGMILAPLTRRGLELVAFLEDLGRNVPGATPDDAVVRERLVQMLFTGDTLRRTAHIELLKSCLPQLLSDEP